MRMQDIMAHSYIVAADDFMDIMIGWNGAGTFTSYREVEFGDYKAVDCFTTYDAKNARDAAFYAQQFIDKMYEDLEAEAHMS
jgi:hypothetical protein